MTARNYLTPRRARKNMTSIRVAESEARDGRHTHVASRDGALWCLTWQPVGFLYALLKAPAGGVSPSRKAPNSAELL